MKNLYGKMAVIAVLCALLTACASTVLGPAQAEASSIKTEKLADGRTRVEERGPHSVLVTIYPVGYVLD